MSERSLLVVATFEKVAVPLSWGLQRDCSLSGSSWVPKSEASEQEFE